MGRIDDILKKLSIEEKIKLTYGKGFWMSQDNSYVDSKIITDGPHGVRLQNKDLYKMFIEDSYPSISYPSLSSLANSFDDKLVYEVARQIGLEANELNVSLLLGPGINIKRHPRGGRNFEYFSEDPLLSGRLGYEYVKGIQKSGVGATVKHFCLNNQEYNRFLSNSVVDDRTFYELYFKPFEISLAAKPCAIMTSYNRYNDIYNSDNKELLSAIRKKYGYKGIFISDWGGTNHPLNSLKAGLNLSMPAVDKTRNDYIYLEYLKNNIKERELDNLLKPLLRFLLKEKKKTSFNINKAKKISLKAAINSMVLLENKDNILPLKRKDKILVCGKFFEEPRFEGNGSSKVNPRVLITPKSAFDNFNVSYDYIPTFDTSNNILNLKEAIKKAPFYDKVLIFVGLPNDLESEGFDRKTLDLPRNYVNSILKISEVNKNVIVIVEAGSQTIINYQNNIKGLLYSFLSGGLMGEAIYQILYGKANPSAKLAESFVKSESDTYLKNNYPVKNINNIYKEGLYVGYPYYYLKNIELNYPFGYGLSYSKYEYSNFKFEDFSIKLCGKSLDKNGYDTLFLFVEDSEKYIRLKDYKKIKLTKSLKEIIFKLNLDMFKFYSEKSKKFVVGTSKYKIHIGTNINNFIYTKEIDIVGEELYIHPQIDLKIKKGIHRKSQLFDQNSTLKDLVGTKYFDYLNEEVNSGEKIENIKDLMSRHERMVQFSSTPLRFYTIYTDLDITWFKIFGIINGLNGNKEEEKFYLNYKNYKLI